MSAPDLVRLGRLAAAYQLAQAAEAAALERNLRAEEEIITSGDALHKARVGSYAARDALLAYSLNGDQEAPVE